MAAPQTAANYLIPVFPLVVAWRAACASGKARGARGGLGLGLACGLAVWNSSLAIPAFAGMAQGSRSPACGHCCIRFRAGLVFGAAFLLFARVIGASGAKVVTASSAVTALRPRWLWGQGVVDLGHAFRGLAGLQVPLVVDGQERADLPAALAVLLAADLLVAFAAGCRSRQA
jgi:hypothetical protein